LNDINGGYDLDNDWMYFKAGAYTQNSLGDGGNSGDGDVVTFYRLEVTH
jgi:poly(beta-D-mannuronate) lyase